jgi:hypothetical protein
MVQVGGDKNSGARNIKETKGILYCYPQFAFRLAFLATAALAAPAAEADADAYYGYGHGLGLGLHGLGYGHHAAALVHHVVPVCKVVPKTVVVGKSCHIVPECTTEDVVIGKHLTGHEEPVCEDVETVVPAVHALGYGHHLGKREADAEAAPEADAEAFHGFVGHAAYAAHPVAVSTTVVHKVCTPGAPIIEDVTAPHTTCVPKEVCEDVTAEVLETVCGEPEAAVEVEA